MQNCFLIFNLNFSSLSLPYFKLLILLFIFFFLFLIFKNYFLLLSFFSFWNKYFSKKFSSNLIQLSWNKNYILLFSIFSLFLLILISNYSGFIPYSLCLSSHISMTIPLGSFFFLLSLVKLNSKEWKNFFLHLIMNNVPLALSPLLIIIESVGVLIRPLTLSVRLAANLTAGHLIMFIACSMMSLMFFDLLIFTGLIFIFILETFVCFIQSYVFSMLSLMYLSSND